MDQFYKKTPSTSPFATKWSRSGTVPSFVGVYIRQTVMGPLATTVEVMSTVVGGFVGT